MANKIYAWAVVMTDLGEPMSISSGVDLTRVEVPDTVEELHLEADRENGTKVINIGDLDGIANGSLAGTGWSLGAGERLIFYDVTLSEVYMLAAATARLNVGVVSSRGREQ